MGLSLTAEQRELLKIFKIEEQYVIPAYQRPYSWGYDECFQLYNDLFNAFNINEDYFIGNIIIAKSDSNKEILEVIDGQQRLTTLLLLIKVLHILQPELKVLEQILEQENWDGSEKRPRIKSDIFEASDGDDLISVLEYGYDEIKDRFEQTKDKNGKPSWKKVKNKFERNLLFFYSWLQFNIENKNNVKEFITYLLRRVSLLPIELTGKTQNEANEKALVIFETMNNRGMNLEDADIFKAKLYRKAKKVNQEGIFIESWRDFKNNCEKLDLEIDDIFRYYSHIIRGKERITSSEINLREFFVRKSYSPFELKKQKEIMDDLFRITEIIEFINQEKNKKSELAKWLQLINVYTNQYPKFAVVTYFFINDLDINKRLIEFLTSLIRYVYYEGSTSTVKFEIYNIIKQISSGQTISDYFKENAQINDFKHLGRLKYGFALLAFYTNRDSSIENYSVDKLIRLKDEKDLSKDWKDIELMKVIDSLGNFVILDIPQKNISFRKKYECYEKSKLSEVKDLLKSDFTYEVFRARDKKLKECLVRFFKGDENE